jgi:hypothetical protein
VTLTAKQAAAQAYALSVDYERAGVWALHDAAQVLYARMRVGQRGRPAQRGTVAGLARRLKEMP